MFTKEVGAIQLKSTIHITHTQAKNRTHQQLPAPRIEFTHPGVLAINPIPQYSIVFTDEGEKALKITNIKLSIGVHEKCQVFSHRLETTHQRSAIALVDSMVDQLYTWIVSSNSLHKSSCSIFAAIIDDNHLEIFHPGRQRINNRLHRLSNHGLLIMGWQNHRETIPGEQPSFSHLCSHLLNIIWLVFMRFTGEDPEPHP